MTTFGPLYFSSETTRHDGGMLKREWRIGLSIGARSFEWSWSTRLFTKVTA